METLFVVILIIILTTICVISVSKLGKKLEEKIIREIKIKDISLLRVASEQEKELFIKNYWPYSSIYSAEKNKMLCSKLFVMDGVITKVSHDTNISIDGLSNKIIEHTIQLEDMTTFVRDNDMKDRNLLDKTLINTNVIVFFEKVDDLTYLYLMYYPK